MIILILHRNETGQKFRFKNFCNSYINNSFMHYQNLLSKNFRFFLLELKTHFYDSFHNIEPQVCLEF